MSLGGLTWRFGYPGEETRKYKEKGAKDEDMIEGMNKIFESDRCFIERNPRPLHEYAHLILDETMIYNKIIFSPAHSAPY